MPQSLRLHLLSTLQALAPARRYHVAFSGGLDSTVLLHLLAGLRDELSGELVALHVDHGLSSESEAWSAHCRGFCERLGVPLQSETVEVHGRRDQGLEAAARQARYAVFEQSLGEDELLLTAHHQDDQAETLLLQLLRGGGVRGLAAMPPRRRLGVGWLVRPLLEVSRERLQAYAGEQGLDWIDDPSNFDTSLERNYLRHTLLPQLERRRGGLRPLLARSAGHFAESARLLDELARMDRERAHCGGECLEISALQRLSPERCRNLLRYHIRRLGLPLPQHSHLQRILDELLPARADATPLVSWPGAEVRRYRDQLYCMPPLQAVPPAGLSLPWDGHSVPQLPQGMGRLWLEADTGQGIPPALLQGRRCELQLRRGGEKLQPAGRGSGHHCLKKLYQEAGVAPWLRQRLPLLFVDGVLAQVPGLWTAQRFAVGQGEVGIMLHWTLSAIENTAQNDDN